MESTNINIRREEVFYTVWRKYPDIDFFFLSEGVLEAIEGFKTKLAKEATPFTEVLDNETHQQSRKRRTRMKIGSSRWTALRGYFWPTCGHFPSFLFIYLYISIFSCTQTMMLGTLMIFFL